MFDGSETYPLTNWLSEAARRISVFYEIDLSCRGLAMLKWAWPNTV